MSKEDREIPYGIFLLRLIDEQIKRTGEQNNIDEQAGWSEIWRRISGRLTLQELSWKGLRRMEVPNDT